MLLGSKPCNLKIPFKHPYMLSEEQIKRLVSNNDSLQVQIADLNIVLAEKEDELDKLRTELSKSTFLRSQMDGQLAEIESIQDKLGQNQMQARGAEERELELKQELNEAGKMAPKYDALAQQYAYLQSQHEDLKAQLLEVNKRNSELAQLAAKVGELESRLSNMTLERDDLRNRLKDLESQKYLREFNL